MISWFYSRPGASVMIAFSERPALNKVSIFSDLEDPNISTRSVKLFLGMLVPFWHKLLALEFFANARKI